MSGGRLRALLRRDVLTICLVIFMADTVTGILSPTFSLYAEDLGASLTMIGALSSVVGLTQFITSMPIGVLSDRYGRRVVVALGMVEFALATALFALAPNAYFLFPGRVLFGVALVSTFSIGTAYVGDVVSREEQGIAFGLYTTAMGLGFGVGPLVGAAVAVGFGIAASYGVASALALVGAGVALKGLRPVRPAQTGSLTRRAGFTWGAVGPLLRNPHLVAGNLASLLMSASFSAITNFFPIYAAESHASQAAINSMFSARSFGSALARLPSGTITSRLPSRWVMFAALLIETVVVAGMAQTNALVLLGVLLVIEGIAFGIFLPSGQALIIEQSTAETRGQIIGIYSTAGSLGSMVGPLAFGVIAEVFGVAAVFRVTSGLILLGLLVIGCLYVRKRPAPGVRVTGVG